MEGRGGEGRNHLYPRVLKCKHKETRLFAEGSSRDWKREDHQLRSPWLPARRLCHKISRTFATFAGTCLPIEGRLPVLGFDWMHGVDAKP